MKAIPISVREYWDRAGQAPQGLVLTVNSKSAAMSLRQRLYRARNIERAHLINLYGEGIRCPWDDLMIEIRPAADGVVEVAIIKDTRTLLKVHEL